MTAVDVDALDKLREAATPGEWRKWGNLHITDGESRDAIGSTWKPADAALIVAMHAALPKLLAEVRRGRARDEVLTKLIATAPVVWNGDYPVKAVPVSDLLSLDALAVLAAVDGGEQS